MNDGLTSLGTVRTQAIVLLLLAFLAGAFAGGAMERVTLRHSRAEAMRRGGRGGPGGPGFAGGRGGRGGPGGLPSMFAKVGLSEAQRARIDSIVKKRSTRSDSLMKMSRAVYDSTRREIGAVLTSEQRAKLDSLRPRRRFGLRGGPGRG